MTAVIPSSQDAAFAFCQAEAALAGLDALKLGKGHRVDGIEYGRDVARGVTQVVVRGEVAALVRERLARGSVISALTQSAGEAMARVAASLLADLRASLDLPAGYCLAGPEEGEVARWFAMVGQRTVSFRLQRPSLAVGGYSGEVRLVMRGGGSYVAVFLTCEATGLTVDRATVIAGDNVSALTGATVRHLNQRFAENAGASNATV